MRQLIHSFLVIGVGLSLGGCMAHDRGERREERADRHEERSEHQRAHEERKDERPVVVVDVRP